MDIFDTYNFYRINDAISQSFYIKAKSRDNRGLNLTGDGNTINNSSTLSFTGDNVSITNSVSGTTNINQSDFVSISNSGDVYITGTANVTGDIINSGEVTVIGTGLNVYSGTNTINSSTVDVNADEVTLSRALEGRTNLI